MPGLDPLSAVGGERVSGFSNAGREGGTALP
jgi:hypothetical protein